jgi:hypothetical protein
MDGQKIIYCNYSAHSYGKEGLIGYQFLEEVSRTLRGLLTDTKRLVMSFYGTESSIRQLRGIKL